MRTTTITSTIILTTTTITITNIITTTTTTTFEQTTQATRLYEYVGQSSDGKHATHATQSHSQHRGLELLLRQVLERRVEALKIVRRDPKPLLTAKNAEPPSCRHIELNEPD